MIPAYDPKSKKPENLTETEFQIINLRHKEGLEFVHIERKVGLTRNDLTSTYNKAMRKVALASLEKVWGELKNVGFRVK